MVCALANTASGLSFGTNSPWRRVLSSERVERMIGKKESIRNTDMAEDIDGNDRMILKVCSVNIYGQSTYSWLDTEAVTDLI